MNREVLLNKAEMAITIEELGKKIATSIPDGKDVVIIGVQRGGVSLAQRIKLILEKIWGCVVPMGQIDIGMHRDDLNQQLPPTMHPTVIPVDITDKIVILIDDVLFSGRTTRAALDTLNDFGRPARVQLAVLIDRGHRELPIQADYVGKYVKTEKNDKVNVLFEETDGVDEVTLEKNN